MDRASDFYIRARLTQKLIHQITAGDQFIIADKTVGWALKVRVQSR